MAGGFSLGGFAAGAMKGLGDIAKGWIDVEQQVELREEYARIEAEKEQRMIEYKRQVMSQERQEVGDIIGQSGEDPVSRREGLLKAGRLEEASVFEKQRDTEFEHGYKNRQLDIQDERYEAQEDYQNRSLDEQKRYHDLSIGSRNASTAARIMGNSSARGGKQGGRNDDKALERHDKWMESSFRKVDPVTRKAEPDMAAITNMRAVRSKYAAKLGANNTIDMLDEFSATVGVDKLSRMSKADMDTAVAAFIQKETGSRPPPTTPRPSPTPQPPGLLGADKPNRGASGTWGW